MKIKKTSIIIYYLLLLVSAIITLKLFANFGSLIDGYQVIDNITYSNLQKQVGIFGIISFIILLIVSYFIYFFTNKITYILLSNILYIAIVLYVFVTLNRNYFICQNIDYSQQSEYWLTIFMGIFYIIGAILISSIGYITIRNYAKRNQQTVKTSKRKNS